MVRLGFIYLGTAELYSKYANKNKCIFWYTKAAEQGDEYACFELGRFYKEGKIVKKDIAKAMYWFDKVIAHDGDYKDDAINELKDLNKKNDKTNGSGCIWRIIIWCVLTVISAVLGYLFIPQIGMAITAAWLGGFLYFGIIFADYDWEALNEKIDNL